MSGSYVKIEAAGPYVDVTVMGPYRTVPLEPVAARALARELEQAAEFCEGRALAFKEDADLIAGEIPEAD